MPTPHMTVAGIRREQSSEKFRYDTPNGQIVLPHASRLYSDMAAKLRNIPLRSRVFWLVEQVLNEKQLELFDALTGRQQTELVEGWMTHGGVRLGELVGLLEVIEEHTAALEGDLIHYFHVSGGVDDFLDDEKFSWRRRSHMVWWLRRTIDSATYMSMNGGRYRWGNVEQSNAALVNAIRALTKSLGGEQMQKSDYYPTPFDDYVAKPKKEKTLEEIRAQHARMKKHTKVEASPEVIAQIMGVAPIPRKD